MSDLESKKESKVKIIVLPPKRFQQIKQIYSEIRDNWFTYNDVMKILNCSRWTAYEILDFLERNDMVEVSLEREKGRKSINKFRFKKIILEWLETIAE